MTDKHIHELVSWKYDGDFIFAFDNIEDKPLIEKKLKRIFELYPNFKKRMKFYVFCGFDRDGKWDNDFWLQDICNIFERCFVLAKYSACPYIMRFEEAYKSPYKGVYTTIAAWCNQPSFFKKTTLKEFSLKRFNTKNPILLFEKQYPEIAEKYFHTAGDMLLEYGSGNKI